MLESKLGDRSRHQSVFDFVPHDLVLRAVRRHTDERWILLYVERWLKAPLQQEDGTLGLLRRRSQAPGAVGADFPEARAAGEGDLGGVLDSARAIFDHDGAADAVGVDEERRSAVV